ncbi:MarR family transcriptional regulator [Paralcaligenes ginsengisoli]
MDQPLNQTEDWITELANRPGHLIRRCYQILMALYTSETKDIGVTPLQYAVLRTVKHQPRRSKRGLGEIAGLDRTTIGWIISSLEKKELLAPTVESAHRRVKHFELTRTGERTLDVLDPRLNAMQDRILEPLHPSERMAFIRSMQKIVAAYNECSRAPLRHESEE